MILSLGRFCLSTLLVALGLLMAAGLPGAAATAEEARLWQFTNSPLVVLDGAHEVLPIAIARELTVLTLDLGHESSGQVFGSLTVDLNEFAAHTNQVVTSVTNSVVEPGTNWPGELVTNSVVGTITNPVVVRITNHVATLMGPIVGKVSGIAGQQTMALAAKVTGWGPAQDKLSWRFKITGYLEDGALKYEGKGAWHRTNSTTTLTFNPRTFKSAGISNPVLAMRLATIKATGDEERGSDRLACEADITVADTSAGLAGTVRRKWNRNKPIAAEGGALKADDGQRGISCGWKADGSSFDAAFAVVKGKYYGQRFVETLPLE